MIPIIAGDAASYHSPRYWRVRRWGDTKKSMLQPLVKTTLSGSLALYMIYTLVSAGSYHFWSRHERLPPLHSSSGETLSQYIPSGPKVGWEQAARSANLRFRTHSQANSQTFFVLHHGNIAVQKGVEVMKSSSSRSHEISKTLPDKQSNEGHVKGSRHRSIHLLPYLGNTMASAWRDVRFDNHRA